MPRRFGVICDDPRAAPLLLGLAEAAFPPSLTVVSFNDAARALCSGIPGLHLCNAWEALAEDESISDVLIGGFAPEALTAARPLAQAGKLVWVLPHPRQGLMFAYEVSLQLEEGQGVVAPVFPDRRRDHWRQLIEARTTGRLNHLDFVRITRSLRGTNVAVDAALEERLLWDLDLVRNLCGRYTRVTALRVGDKDATRQQTVTLSGEGAPELMWTFQPGKPEDLDRIELHRGNEAWELQEVGEEAHWASPPPDEILTAAPRDLLAALFPADVTADAWRDAVEAFELFDGVQHSLERRRTIDLHREPVSERTIFKTRMVALGCLVLSGTLFLMMAYLAIASVVPLGNTVLLVLRALVFTPLAVFLLIQLLLPLSRSARPRPAAENAEPRTTA